MICSSIIRKKANLTRAQDIVFVKEVYYSIVSNTAKYLPQITAHTNASEIIRVQFVSTLVNRGNESLAPDVRRTA